MPAVPLFPLVPGVEYSLSHYQLDAIPDLFQKGIRQIKDVSIKSEAGMAFPLDLQLDSCGPEDGRWFPFTGTVYRGNEQFSFSARSNGADATITFQRKGVA